MADAAKLIRALLGKAYKLPKTEIDRILSDDTDDDAGETEVLQTDTTRVAELKKPKPGSSFQDGYAKGKKESLTQLETELKTKYGIEDTDAENPLTGQDLVEAILTKQAGSGGGKLDENAVKAHPAYQAAEKAWKKALKDKETELTTKITELETKHEREQSFSTVSKKIIDTLTAMNPVLPASAEVAETWRQNFVKSFTEYEWKVNPDGSILAMKDGKVVEDGHGSTLDFETLVKERAGKFFEFKANNGGGNAGNGRPGEGGNAGGGKPYPANITKPKTFDDYAKIINDSSIKLEDRQVVQQVWEQEQAAGSQ